MPLYDYGCPSCGFEKEVQHPMSEIGKAIIVCDQCGKQMGKLLSAPSLIGFDDVGRSISKKDTAGSEAKSTGESKASGDAKPAAESKSATKKDAA
ncbi:MAG: zinc ribbon domain-containing protein [Cyclobacteriaceae bacterium]|nr:zinc ribbon domain-containing protein [Cyclobacteriaceae bacterium]